jgi:hypothetical protein
MDNGTVTMLVRHFAYVSSGEAGHSSLASRDFRLMGIGSAGNTKLFPCPFNMEMYASTNPHSLFVTHSLLELKAFSIARVP